MNKALSVFLFIGVIVSLFATCDSSSKRSSEREKTCFQTASPWRPELDIRSDVAIIYGPASADFEERLGGWKEKGYKIHMMTGVAWGEYQDYFKGEYDGKEHLEDAQTRKEGEIIWHGHDVPYVVPSGPYINYLKSLIKKAIDAGVTAIHLEEPEFWAFAGYSESFKKEWKKYYGFDWMAHLPVIAKVLKKNGKSIMVLTGWPSMNHPKPHISHKN